MSWSIHQKPRTEHKCSWSSFADIFHPRSITQPPSFPHLSHKVVLVIDLLLLHHGVTTQVFLQWANLIQSNSSWSRSDCHSTHISSFVWSKTLTHIHCLSITCPRARLTRKVSTNREERELLKDPLMLQHRLDSMPLALSILVESLMCIRSHPWICTSPILISHRCDGACPPTLTALAYSILSSQLGVFSLTCKTLSTGAMLTTR